MLGVATAQHGGTEGPNLYLNFDNDPASCPPGRRSSDACMTNLGTGSDVALLGGLPTLENVMDFYGTKKDPTTPLE